jgi:hypothetical protein
MRQYFAFILLMIVFSLHSCENNTTTTDQDYPFDAEVLGINLDCGLNEIKFSNNLNKVIGLFGKSVIDSVYIAGNLPDSLKIPGLKILVNIGNPSNQELTACTTQGPSLNWVWITGAKPK